MVVLLLFINYLLLLLLFVGFCVRSFKLVLWYFVYFLVLQSSRWGRESWLLYFCCVLKVMTLLSFFDPYSRCQVLVCIYVIVAFPGPTYSFTFLFGKLTIDPSIFTVDHPKFNYQTIEGQFPNQK